MPCDAGGLGEVFVARDDLDRRVALKFLKPIPARDDLSRRRFFREVQLTGRLDHPGIVPIYGGGEIEGGRPFYAMRFVDGQSLGATIREIQAAGRAEPSAGSLPAPVLGLLRRFLSVCETIAFAHSRGVLHRDLKPGNIMLGPYGETLVVDWGLAKLITSGEESEERGGVVPGGGGDPEETEAGSTLGTPGYQSPEQARGERTGLGVATDIYSLGATLYTILTGRPPFGDATPHAVRGRTTPATSPLPGPSPRASRRRWRRSA